MAAFFSVVMIGFCAWITHVVALDQGTNIAEVIDFAELKIMYNGLLKENSKMKRQIGRINVVYNGLQAMCDTMQLSKADGNSKEERTENTKQEGEFQQTENEWIELISISSSVGNFYTTITVIFKFSGPVDNEWQVVYHSDNEIMRQHGHLTRDGDVYNSTYQVIDVPKVRMLHLWIYSKSDSRVFGVRLGSELRIQSSYVDQIQYRKFDTELESSYQTIEGQNLTIDGPMLDDGKPVNITDANLMNSPTVSEIFCEYSYVDPVAQTLNIVNNFQSEEFGLHIYGIENNKAIEDYSSHYVTLIIMMNNKLTQFGGLLRFYIVSGTNKDDVSFVYSRTIYILPPGGNSPIPENSVSLFKQENLYLNEKHSSVYCLSAGNPVPNVQLFKVRGKGRAPKPMRTEVFKTDYDVIRAANFVNKKASDIRGTYICRATYGDVTVETRMNVEVYREVVIQKAQVKKNTSEEMIVTCKATGSPRPIMKFMSISPYDTDLGDTYQITDTTLGRYGRKIEMVIPGGDTLLSIVTCAAEQGPYKTKHEEIIV